MKHRSHGAAAIALILATTACATRTFRIAGQPPALHEPGNKARRPPAPLTTLLQRDYHFTLGNGYIDLLPGMRLSAMRGYFRSDRIQLADYLGAETVRWELVRRRNMAFRATAIEPFERNFVRPAGFPSPDRMIAPSARTRPLYRLFFSAFFQRGDARGSVVLGARTQQEMDAATQALLANNPVDCAALDCIPFPPGTTVTAEIGFEANGQPQWLPAPATAWMALNGKMPSTLTMHRRNGRSLLPVLFQPFDETALRQLPLLPGDRLRWQ